MSDHDAASVVARLAGMGEAKAPLPPQELIERFCGDSAPGSRTGTAVKDGMTVSKGFCGFTGSSGYDDGYGFMGDLLDRGWGELPGKGDWPYLVYLAWLPKGPEDKHAIAEYIEGDLTVWVFDSIEIANRHYAGLKNIP